MKLRLLFLILILFCSLMTFGQRETVASNEKIIMVVLAHPDDETAMGPVLAKYAADNKVYLVLAADGRYGTREHAGIPAGDSLAQIRKVETICSCNALGIEPPIFLGFHDGLGSRTGLGEYFRQTAKLKEKLKLLMEEINPDVIITFGPDGDTGHPDHRAISDITTEIILREGWYEKYPLHFVGFPNDETDTSFTSAELNSVDEKYLNVRIKYNEAHREKHFESIRCHKSQWTEDEMNEWLEMEKSNTSYTAYFRKFVVDTNIKKDFFEK
ncbi:MAG: PIG-L family deacetylase [Ignavibacteriales bacterium]|nr:MAG: PIG-L family deacetylase [Ignavibacteriales bacterium]